MEIRIYKSKKLMEVLENGTVIKTFPIGIGKNETGHKREEGDFRTPEGEYVVCVKNPKSKFYLSLGLNYPNNADAEAALGRGDITEAEYRAIREANDAGKIPPWKTRMGGEIFIHGELEKKSWSEGCIRVNNPDMKYLFDTATIGTRVVIFP